MNGMDQLLSAAIQVDVDNDKDKDKLVFIPSSIGQVKNIAEQTAAKIFEHIDWKEHSSWDKDMIDAAATQFGRMLSYAMVQLYKYSDRDRLVMWSEDTETCLRVRQQLSHNMSLDYPSNTAIHDMLKCMQVWYKANVSIPSSDALLAVECISKIVRSVELNMEKEVFVNYCRESSDKIKALTGNDILCSHMPTTMNNAIVWLKDNNIIDTYMRLRLGSLERDTQEV